MLLQLITNRYLRNRCIKVLKKVIDSSYLLLNSYLLFLKIMLKVFKRICIFRSLRSRFFRKRFRKKFSILKMRIVELFMMMNVFLSVGYFMVLRLENALFSYGLYRRYKMPKKDSKLDFLCFIAIQFCTSELLGNYLCRNLSLVKNHFRVLRKFMSTVEKFYLKSRFNFYGLLIRIAGKLQGKMRKSKYQYKIGKANRQVFKIPISYFFGISVTRFGVLSIKVWLFFYENNS